MPKVEYWMNPMPVEFLIKNPKLTAKVISNLVKYVKACDKARDRLSDDLQKLALPNCRESEKIVRR